jgi:energy-coupling factor transporter ATP-binding protein EcfA2
MNRIISILLILLILMIGGMVLWEVLAQGTKVWTRYKLLKEPLPSLTALLPTSLISLILPILLLLMIIAMTAVAVIRSRRLFGLIPVEELKRHLVILGPTGSGKTTVAKAIIAKVLAKSPKTSLIIIDWKGEYTSLPMATVIRKVDFWNIPAESPREKALVALEMLREISRDVVEISPASSLLLLKILEEEYRRGTPTTEKLITILEKSAMIASREGKYAESNMYYALARRLYILSVDEERKDENTAGDPMITIYDLSSLPSVHLKVLYGNFILASIYRKAMKTHGKSDGLRTLVIAEEAQNYVRPRRHDELPSLPERLIFELRSFGVGVVLVCPDPELLPAAILRDVGTTIAMSPDSLPRFTLERHLFRASLEEAEDTLKKLKKSRLIIYHNQRLYFLRRLPKPKVVKLKAGPKGDRMGVTNPWAGGRSLQAWPILPRRSPGRPATEVKEEVEEEKPKVIEVITEPTTESKPKVLETVEELRLEPEEEEAVEKEVTKEQAIEEEEFTVEEEAEMVEEEMPLEESKPEPVPKGPPIPSTLPYRGSLCPAGRSTTALGQVLF